MRSDMKTGFRTSSRNVVLTVISVTLLVALAIFYAVVHPLLSWAYLPAKPHEGVQYYHQNQYLKFPSGKRFQMLLEDVDFLQNGQVVDFYHVNNWMRDNPFYGKISDVFSVDVYLDAETFEQVHDAVAGDTSDTELYRGKFFLYQSDYQTGTAGDVVMFAVHKSEPLVRIILVTDCEPEDSGEVYGDPVLGRHANLDWEGLNIPARELGYDSNHILELDWARDAYASEATTLYHSYGWDFSTTYRYGDTAMQEYALQSADAYLLSADTEYTEDRSLCILARELGAYFNQRELLPHGYLPKSISVYCDGYILIEFLIPVFDANGLEITPEDADTVYALISAEDGHIIHFGRASD